MMSTDNLSQRNLYILFAVSIAGEVFAMILFILLSAFDYIGFDGNNPISASCPITQTYYYFNKYSQTVLLVEISYIFSLLSLVAFSVALGIMIKCVLNARTMPDSDFFVSKCIKVTLYVLASFAIMAAIPPFGYYLSVVAQINYCSASYDSSKVPAVVAMAAVLLAVLLLFFILLFAFFCNSSDEKYREVQTHPTEPVERVNEVKYFNKKYLEKEEPYKKQPEIYEKRTPQEMEKNSPPKRVPNRTQELQHTKEHLFNSPSRQPTINVYSKEVDPHPLLRQSPTQRNQPAPILQPKTYIKQTNPSQNPQRYISPSRVPKENEGELVFHKPRTRGLANDEEEFSREQNRYLSKYADRPILSSGVKEVNGKKGIPDAFHSGELPRRNGGNSPPSRLGANREGNLVNYIRGKYAN